LLIRNATAPENKTSDDVEQARSQLTQARAAGRPDVVAFILNVVAALEKRYKKMNQQLPDVEERIQLLNEALGLLGPDSSGAYMFFMPLRVLMLTTTIANQTCRLKLAKALEDRYHHTGELGDLDECITITRALKSSLSLADVNYAAAVTVLSTALRERYSHVGNKQDLDDAISALSPSGMPCTNCGASVCTGADSPYLVDRAELGCKSCQIGVVGIAHRASSLSNEGELHDYLA
jgi:hypothetical protein